MLSRARGHFALPVLKKTLPLAERYRLIVTRITLHRARAATVAPRRVLSDLKIHAAIVV